MRRYALFVTVILVLGIMVAGCGRKKPEQAAVDTGILVKTGSPRTGMMTSTIEVSGQIKALKWSTLSAKSPGRVVSVAFREGDRVGAGAVVVQQDITDLRTQVLQAQAGLQSAKARLSQAVTGAGLSNTQTESGIAQAKAGLDSAKARLQMIKKGARSQELKSAENAVASAEANFRNAEINLKRTRDLYSQGAQSKQQMDLVQMQYDIADAQFDTSKQQLSLVKAGARDEEIESAQKSVEQAEEAYRIAKSNRANNAIKDEDIKSAKAGVALANAQLEYARQQLANAYIRTPVAGTVSKRNVEPGLMANPGVSLIEVVALDSVYFEATVSEMDVDKIKAGQPVAVSVDALSGKKFIGVIKKILPVADPSSRQFTARIEIANRKGDLKPGMFARGSIEIDRHPNTLIITKDALVSNGDSRAVYIVTGSTAKLVPVTIGFETREEAEILSGVSINDNLVVLGQDKLSDGVKVNAVN
ncbi:MAG: efflux RND transporter periplasmic adaptor subunit [Armatimonadota bacterium]